MASPSSYNNVLIASIDENGPFTAKFNHPVDLSIQKTGSGAKIELSRGKDAYMN